MICTDIPEMFVDPYAADDREKLANNVALFHRKTPLTKMDG
jgi:hypothetical protein